MELLCCTGNRGSIKTNGSAAVDLSGLNGEGGNSPEPKRPLMESPRGTSLGRPARERPTPQSLANSPTRSQSGFLVETPRSSSPVSDRRRLLRKQASFQHGADIPGGKDEICLRLVRLATRLRGPVHGFGSSCGAVAALTEEAAAEAAAAAPPRPLHLELVPAMHGEGLQQWEQGQLAFWESEDAFGSGLEPEATMGLLRITKVHHLDKRDTGCQQRITHKEGSEPRDIILLHASCEEAKAATEGLIEFISTLRAALGRSERNERRSVLASDLRRVSAQNGSPSVAPLTPLPRLSRQTSEIE